MPSLQALDVIVADDSANMRKIVATLLLSAGITKVRQAVDGWDAMTQLRAQRADLVIVDLNMKPLDGLGFTRLIRADRHSPDPYLPILMMTGHAELTWVREARDAGVTEFVVKPFTPKAFLSRIEAMVMRPRPFVRSGGYFGPCRRRAREAPEGAPRRRASDAVMV
ncbi:response regulator [Caulobacter sp. 17J65-9]|uniref:response regulator n=1 Tax=Caulobacter sp. 17J65-9 TaxID=2709382 RepID=UPI0013C8858B|nr:response regulator [Caulobacter sp. 17J65-9]NEX92628.1 response regulator [Caulobacter sp. 17J65-9]